MLGFGETSFVGLSNSQSCGRYKGVHVSDVTLK